MFSSILPSSDVPISLVAGMALLVLKRVFFYSVGAFWAAPLAASIGLTGLLTRGKAFAIKPRNGEGGPSFV